MNKTINELIRNLERKISMMRDAEKEPYVSKKDSWLIRQTRLSLEDKVKSLKTLRLYIKLHEEGD